MFAVSVLVKRDCFLECTGTDARDGTDQALDGETSGCISKPASAARNHIILCHLIEIRGAARTTKGSSFCIKVIAIGGNKVNLAASSIACQKIDSDLVTEIIFTQHRGIS